MLSMGQFSKAFSEVEVVPKDNVSVPSSKINFFNPLHPEKAEFPMEVTDFGIVNDDNLLQP